MTTLKDIAQRAGVSTCTVSKILSGRGHERYTPECRKRVQAAAKALHFAPNHAARSLRAGTTGILAFAADWLPRLCSGAFSSAIISACEMAAWRHGCHLLVVGARPGRSAALAARDLLHQRHCDGMVVADGDQVRDDLRALRGERVTFLDRPPSGFGGGELGDAAGIDAAVRHLAEKGHRRALWIGVGEMPRSDLRQEAFVRACAALEMDAHALVVPPCQSQDDQDHIESVQASLLARRAELTGHTALMCYNDLSAIGAYAALAALGRRVPHDVSVIGFDNVHAATALPALTTIDHELAALADAAIAALMDGGGRRHVPARLVLRASTAPVPVA